MRYYDRSHLIGHCTSYLRRSPHHANITNHREYFIQIAMPTKMAQEKYSNFPEVVKKALQNLENDEFFQTDLKTPLIQEAIEHWLGINRLPAEIAEEKFNDDYRVRQAFMKIKTLQDLCVQEKVTFPIDFILKKSKKASTGESNLKESTIGTTTTNLPITSSNSSPRSGGVLRKRQSSEARVFSKEPSVKFAEPAKEVEVTFQVQKEDDEYKWKILNSSWFSLEPQNIARWWSLQFFLIGLFIATYL